LLFLRDISGPTEVFADVGANVGAYCIVAASSGATAVAFEPDPRARAVLQENIRLNQAVNRVAVLSVALGAGEGRARLTNNMEAGNHLVHGDESVGSEVRVRALDTVFAELGLVPTIIKIDVEGHDEQVLRGSRQVLDQAHPILIIEVWAGGQSIRGYLAPFGYRFFRYRRESRSLVALPTDFAGDANLIAIHADVVPAIEERLEGHDPQEDLAPSVRWMRPRL
jgi:FkbM family methyltransferase